MSGGYSYTAVPSSESDRSMLAGMAGSNWERAYGGPASIAFFVSNMLAFIISLCIILYIWGLGSIPLNTDVALALSWSWWRMYSPAIMAVAPPLIIWINYQFRKGWGEKGIGTFSSALVTILYFIGTVILAFIAAWLILCAVWYGIADWVDCAAHIRCSGTSLSSTPANGAIMIIIAWGLAALCICVELVLELYLWYSIRNVITMSVTQFNSSPFAFQSQIGAEHGRAVPNADDYAEMLRRYPITDAVATAAIIAHRSGKQAVFNGYTSGSANAITYTVVPTSEGGNGGDAGMEL